MGDYEESSDQDNTAKVLSELLSELPEDGQANLIMDIMARDDDRKLEEFVKELKVYLFTSMFIRCATKEWYSI